jgi:hypothetical protein
MDAFAWALNNEKTLEKERFVGLWWSGEVTSRRGEGLDGASKCTIVYERRNAKAKKQNERTTENLVDCNGLLCNCALLV